MEIFPKRIRDLTFWHYQIAGWLSMACLQILITTATLGRWDSQMLFSVLLQVVLGFLLTSLLRYLYRRVRYQSLSLLSIISLMIVCSAGVTMILFGCFLLIEHLTGIMAVTGSQDGLIAALLFLAYGFPDKIAWSALYFGITFWRGWQDEREQAEHAAAEAQQAQLQTLRYRLNPHFLFHTLDSTRALVDEDPQSARRVVTELAEFLRYSLVSQRKPCVLLQEELEAIRLYLSIEQRRYKERLQTNFDISEESQCLLIPNFLVYPLVEYALRNGIEECVGAFCLKIHTRVANNMLYVSVAYPCQKAHDGDEFIPAGDLLQRRYRFRTEERDGMVQLILEIPVMHGAPHEGTVASNHR